MNAETIKNTIQAIIDGLTPLAQKLSVPLEKIFEWAVRENYVIAIENLIGALVSITIIILFFIFLSKSFKNKEWGDYELGRNAIMSIITGIISFILVILLFFEFIPQTLKRLINPEYHALIDIVDMVKPSSYNK